MVKLCHSLWPIDITWLEILKFSILIQVPTSPTTATITTWTWYSFSRRFHQVYHEIINWSKNAAIFSYWNSSFERYYDIGMNEEQKKEHFAILHLWKELVGVILWFSSVMIQSAVVQYGVLQYNQWPCSACSGTDHVTRCPVFTSGHQCHRQPHQPGPWQNGLAPIGLN